MFLKRIEIQGFKSFADKTVLDFLPGSGGKESITVIVGPNGSGKSNVADALRWVMGEQSLKLLRGKKSEDIIFAGSEHKGQLSMASVFITFDNTDKKAPIDYEELVIGRRLYRSGESEYIINGHEARLIDVNILLAKAQTGSGAHGIIGQGMIDKMILQSMEERKEFFDEASGIKEFQIKRHQAMLRLDRTRSHISQAELLFHEIEPRLKILSRQVQKLTERQEVEIELRELQERHYATLATQFRGQIQVLRNEIFAIDDNLRLSEKNLLSIQEELAHLSRESSRQEIFTALQNEYQDVVKQKNALERELTILEGKSQSEYRKAGATQVGWMKEKVETLKNDQSLIEKEIENIEKETATKQSAVNTLQNELQRINISKVALRGDITRLETEMTYAKAEQSVFQLTGLRAVQAVLEARNQLGDIFGVVATLGKVEKEYVVALDVAAGNYLSSIVISDENVAKKCIDYLRSNQFGVATFLPLTTLRPRQMPEMVKTLLKEQGVRGLAMDLIKYNAKYNDVFSLIFGSTLVVEDMDAARAVGIGRIRMVTLQGDLFETSGVVKGGYRRGRDDRLSFASGASAFTDFDVALSEAELKNKRAEFEHFEIRFEECREELQARSGELLFLKSKMDLQENQKKSVDSEIAALEHELNLETLSPEQYSEVLKDIEIQKQMILDTMQELDQEIALAESKVNNFHAEEEVKKQRVFALQDSMQELQASVNAAIAQKNTRQIELAKLETREEDIAREVFEELHVSLDSIASRGHKVFEAAEQEQVGVRIQKLKYTLSLIGGIDESVVAEYEETKSRFDNLDGQLKDLKKTLNDLETLVQELDDIMKKKRNKAFKEMKKEFARYFAILFDGGSADLIEVYEDEIEGSESEEKEADVDTGSKKVKKILKGIDILACPPGKKINNIQALSGGERTLTSIALICAILRTNPSPFVILDEVEAALDEANTLRVVQILKELSEASQFIIITHNRVTMHAADAIYGVTMGGNGVSQLLSVKLAEAKSS
jgi:chromosome segregation protein